MTPAELIALERATLINAPANKKKRKEKKGGKRKKKSKVGSDKGKRKRNVKETDATKAASAAVVEEDEDAEDQEAHVTAGERKNGLVLAAHKTNKFRDLDDVRLLPQLTRVLKPHQVIGVRFLWKQITASNGGQGCILADHMGLGKTLQVISLIHLFLSAHESLFSGEATAKPARGYGLGGPVPVIGNATESDGAGGVGTTAVATAGPSVSVEVTFTSF
jgi:SNF2 family DNA or RNA helicase